MLWSKVATLILSTQMATVQMTAVVVPPSPISSFIHFLMVRKALLLCILAIIHHIFVIGTPCDADGFDLPFDSPPPLRTTLANDDFSPFLDRPDFEMADFLYKQDQMPGQRIDHLMEILAAKYSAENVPYANHESMYEVIDSIEVGDAPWGSFSAKYTGEIPEGETPPWMLAEYDVWCRNPRTVLRNQLANPDFDGEIDYAPKQEFGAGDQRRYQDFMSGNWSWTQAVSGKFVLLRKHLVIILGHHCRER